MTQTPPRLVCLTALLVVVGGCAIGRFEDPDQEPKVPDGPIEVMGDGPTGPVTVLGSGLEHDTGWRFASYESNGERCFQVEMNTRSGGGSAAAGCTLISEADEALTQVGAGAETNGVGHIHGVAAPEVAEVLVHARGGRRLPTRLYDLDQAEMEGKAFFVIVPADVEPLSVVAVDAEGGELGRADVSRAFR